MLEREFPAPGPGAGINSQIEVLRAVPVVVRNSRFLIGVTRFGSVSAVFMALSMALAAISVLFPLSGFTLARTWNVLGWSFSACATGWMCPWLWKLGMDMANYQVRLDSRGVEFCLGTKKNPQELFLAWDQIVAIKHQRSGNIQIYNIYGSDDSQLQFTSYTFFRPKKLARLIAARAGQSIQQG